MAEQTISKAQSGSSIHVKVGDSVVVRLPENPTTGFRWSVDAAGEPVLMPAGDDYILGQDAGVGGGGERVFCFTAKSPGNATLRLKNWRHWEGEASVMDRFTLAVEVS